MRLDEQEATRALLLSPETTQSKIDHAVSMATRKEADLDAYTNEVNSNPERIALKERIVAIRGLNIKRITVQHDTYAEEKFRSLLGTPKPRHMRDIAHFMQLVKTITLLNPWHRAASESQLVSTKEDIDQAIELWSAFAVTQELNIPPYVLQFFNEFIVGAYRSFNEAHGGPNRGIQRKHIGDYHMRVQGSLLNDDVLRRQILPALETSGLIAVTQDPNDKRNKLITPNINKVGSPLGGAAKGEENDK